MLPMLLLLCLSVASSQDLPARGQSAGGTRTVTGSVILRGSSPISVRVTIQSTSRSFHRIVFADGSGSFVVSGVPVGQHHITLEAEGFITVRESLDVPPGTGALPVQYMMRPAPPIATPHPKESSVSVPSLKIPPEAQKELEAGMRELRDKRADNARRHFEKALTKHADYAQALHALALLDAGEQQSERAMEKLRKALAIDPTYAEGYVSLARILNLLSQHIEALDTAHKAVELRPDLWQGHYESGLAALSLGQDSAADESAKQIEKLAGLKVPELRLLRAGILLKQSKFAEAKSELLAFLELAPQHSFAALARQTLLQIEKQLSPH